MREASGSEEIWEDATSAQHSPATPEAETRSSPAKVVSEGTSGLPTLQPFDMFQRQVGACVSASQVMSQCHRAIHPPSEFWLGDLLSAQAAGAITVSLLQDLLSAVQTADNRVALMLVLEGSSCITGAPD